MNLSTLMAIICGCPEGAAINDIPVSTCQEDFGQIQKVVFQRIKKADGTPNIIDIATTNPNVVGTWNALKQAADGTKVTVSPFIQNPESEPGAKREFGGGNQTLGGIPIPMGSEPSTFKGLFYRIRQDVIAAIKTYGCENIGVFLVNENGQLAGVTDSIATPTKFSPFPIQGFFVGDKKMGGLEEPDSNAVDWAFPANWSDKFLVVTPVDFKANTDL